MTTTIATSREMFHAIHNTRSVGYTALFSPRKRPRELSNLGWLLRNDERVHDFYVSSGGHPSVLAARLDEGEIYVCGFADWRVLAEFLDRPKFRGKTVTWNCRAFIIGSTDYRVELVDA